MIDHNLAGAVLSEMVQIGRTFRVAGQHNREDSLVGTKFGVLQYLGDCDTRLSGLADRLSISMPVASRAVDSLEADGMVERRPDPEDARASVISITDFGRAKVAESENHVVGQFADALADWSPIDAEEAVRMIHRLNRHLAEVIGAPESSKLKAGRARPHQNQGSTNTANRRETHG